MEGQALVSDSFCDCASLIWTSSDLCPSNRRCPICLYFILILKLALSGARPIRRPRPMIDTNPFAKSVLSMLF